MSADDAAIIILGGFILMLAGCVAYVLNGTGRVRRWMRRHNR